MFELRHLRYFVAVAESESIGRAAEALHVSASPLSRQIQQLEAQLGAALFTRQKQRLRLTKQGRDFLEQAKALLAQAEAMHRRARAAADTQSGTLMIGYVEGAIHGGVLPADLRAFRQRYPRVRVELRTLRSAEQAAALLNGQIDIGYLHDVPPGIEGLKAVRVLDEAFRLAIPSSHALAKGTGMVPARLLDGESFISMPQASAPEVRKRLLEISAACGFRPDVRYEATEPSVVLGLVAAGLGMAILQESLSNSKPKGVAWRPMPRGYASRLRVHRVAMQQPSALAAAYLGSLRKD